MEIILQYIQYIPYIIVLISLILGIISYVINQKKSIKEWLLLAVSEAEKLLGEKTGKLKLRQVFESFVKLYPVFSKFVTFTTFSSWVDIALEEMKVMIKNNKAVQEYVGIENKKGDD